MHGIRPETRLVREIDVGCAALGSGRDFGIGLALPALDGFGVSLVRALQRFLRRQPQARQHSAHSRDAKLHAELLLNQHGRDLPRPQPEVQTVLPRALAIDPSEHLRLLRCRELARPTGRRARNQRAFAFAPS